MKKEITVKEWLDILVTVLGNLSGYLEVGKISLNEALSLTVTVITEIINAYNN